MKKRLPMLPARLCLFIPGLYLIIDGFIESRCLDGQVIETPAYILLYAVGTILLLSGLFLPRIRKATGKSVVLRIIGILLCGVLLFLFVTAGLIAAWPQFAPRADGNESVLLVLGAPVINDRPSYILQSRADMASEWAGEHPDEKVIIAGGKGGTETEAETIADIMAGQGIDQSRMTLENASTTTEENLCNVRELLAEEDYDVTEEPVIIMTNYFHVFRLHYFLNRQGYGNVSYAMVPTPSSVGLLWYTREVVLTIRFWFTGIS